MTHVIVGDLLTGRRIQTVPAVTARWSDTINQAGDLSATVSLRDPDVRRLGLRASATPGKSFLAVVDGDTVLQAGPIWRHEYDGESQRLTMAAAGMWSYFDHRVLLPVLAGRSPTDPTTDTNLVSSLQGIARALVLQAQSWTGGNVPVNVPAEIAGSNERNYLGADLGIVGERLKQLTEVEGGPDIRFVPKFTPDRLGVEWDMLIGTPTQPRLASNLEPVFNVGLAGSSVSGLKLAVDAKQLAGQAFASGGRSSDEVLIAVGTGSTLSDAGFPLLEKVDSSRATVTRIDTLRAFADEIVLQGARPVELWQFSHDLASTPFLTGFTVGDFARVRVHSDPYLPAGDYRMRILSRSGDEQGRKVNLTFQPTESFDPAPPVVDGVVF